MSYTLVLLNYAGYQQKFFTKLYLPIFRNRSFDLFLIKSSTMLLFVVASFDATPSVALLFFLLCSVFKVHLRLSSVVENSGIEPLTS